MKDNALNPRFYFFLGVCFLAFAGLSIYLLRFSIDWAVNVFIGIVASIAFFVIAWDARNFNREQKALDRLMNK
jgi:hypothetical protein